MLEVRNLTKRYGTNNAVSDLSFDIGSGGIYGFLGPNGAGKSTTMNIITGYLAATSGSVVIDGHDILKEPREAKKRMGYLPEVPPLYPDLTVREYLNFAAELKGIKRAGRSSEVGDIMDRTGLYGVESRLIRNLSKGYRQRTGIACALLGYPELIILDEPTAGLDPAQIIEIRDLILSLKDDHAVILSSHILQEISAVCDHIMVISHGRLMAEGTPDDIMKSMNVENRTVLLAKAGREKLGEILSGTAGVVSVDTCDVENDTVKAEIKSDPDVDIREDIFRAVVNSGFALLDMHSDSMSLEDVYMYLTSDEYAASLQREAEEAEGADKANTAGDVNTADTNTAANAAEANTAETNTAETNITGAVNAAETSTAETNAAETGTAENSGEEESDNRVTGAEAGNNTEDSDKEEE